MTLAHFAGEPWLGMHACVICVSARGINKQMDSHIGLQKWASLLAHGFVLKPWVTVISRCEGRDDMGRYLYPHIGLRTRVCTRRSHRQRNRLLYHQKFDGPFGAWFHFLKDFWEPTSVGVKVVFLVYGNAMDKHPCSYIESRTLRVHTCMYTTVLWTHQRRDGLSAFGSILKIFANRCRLV